MWQLPNHCWAKIALLAGFITFASGALAQSEQIDPELRHVLSLAVHNSASFVDQYEAQVWLVPRSSWLELYVEDPQERVDLLTAIHAESVRADLDPDLVMSLIEIESGFDPYAVSRSGALGLMQVMSFWKAELGRPEDNLTDIATNLRYGCAILAYYLEMESGDLEPALARYNGSHGQSWYSDRVLTALAKWP
jgi:soluble lytic murein transglycosylase-like protein